VEGSFGKREDNDLETSLEVDQIEGPSVMQRIVHLSRVGVILRAQLCGECLDLLRLQIGDKVNVLRKASDPVN
jgi:hypothetical protein